MVTQAASLFLAGAQKLFLLSSTPEYATKNRNALRASVRK
ncbi:protein of unknown function [Methylocella tundrae]|uniref:Uncharacterized protein n=1 Tax=Methylocella tundrae TaxID=227605 RepID=A0A4U8Z130_METTU|nr:protein of unknown function [Methylocella tundrae]